MSDKDEAAKSAAQQRLERARERVKALPYKPMSVDEFIAEKRAEVRRELDEG